MAGLEVVFARILIAEIHEKAFKTTFTFPFLCLIFHQCRGVGIPIWHFDSLIEATKTMDIGIIRDDANLVAQRKEPQVNLPPLGADLVVDVEQIQVDDIVVPLTTTDAQAPPSTSTSQAESSSRATPSLGSTIVPLARF